MVSVFGTWFGTRNKNHSTIKPIKINYNKAFKKNKKKKKL